jgi:copper chaperone CopZ
MVLPITGELNTPKVFRWIFGYPEGPGGDRMNLFGKPKGNELTIEVEGMTCGHCVARVEKALRSCNGVLKARVDLNKKIAVILYDPARSNTAEFVKKIEDAGYKARMMN